MKYPLLLLLLILPFTLQGPVQLVVGAHAPGLASDNATAGLILANLTAQQATQEVFNYTANLPISNLSTPANQEYSLEVQGEHDTLYYLGNHSNTSERYNGVYIEDGSRGIIRLARIIDTFTAGSVLVLDGINFTIVDATRGWIQMGPTITKLVPSNLSIDTYFDENTSIILHNFEPAPDGRVILSGQLYIKSIAGRHEAIPFVLDLIGLPTTSDITDSIRKETGIIAGHVYLQGNYTPDPVNASTQDSGVWISVVKDNQLVAFGDGSRVLGYTARVNNTELGSGCQLKDCSPQETGRGRLVLLSDRITLREGPQLLLGLDWGANFTAAKILSFGTTDRVLSEAGTDDSSMAMDNGGDKAIVMDQTADKTQNLILIGGPAANSLTAELVKAGKSKVNWYSSPGEVEAIPDAFTRGRTVIIVAGKDRGATKVATQKLLI